MLAQLPGALLTFQHLSDTVILDAHAAAKYQSIAISLLQTDIEDSAVVVLVWLKRQQPNSVRRAPDTRMAALKQREQS